MARKTGVADRKNGKNIAAARNRLIDKKNFVIKDLVMKYRKKEGLH